MAVHFDRGLKGKIGALKLKPVAICVAPGLEWFGGVTQADQQRLLKLQMELEAKYQDALRAGESFANLSEMRSASSQNGAANSPAKTPSLSEGTPKPSTTSSPKKSG